MRLPRLEPFMSSCTVSNVCNVCVDTCQAIYGRTQRSVIMMIGLFAFLALFGLQDANAQTCAGRNFDGTKTFVCNSERSATVSPTNYSNFGVVNTAQYQWTTCGSGYNTRLSGRANGPSGTGLFVANSNVCDGLNEIVTWNSTFNGSVSVIVSLNACSWTTSSAILKWQQLDNFTHNTSTAALCVGGTRGLSVSGAGSGGSFAKVGGPGSVSGSTYSANGGAGTATIRYTLGVCTEDRSFTVAADPTVSISGAGTVCSGGGLTLSANTSGGAGSCSFQWQIEAGVNTNNWFDITGATGSSYGTGGLSSSRRYRVRRICDGSGCDDPYSSPVLVSVVADPSITASGATTICVGGNATLSSSTSGGTGSCSYQWQVGTSSSGPWSNFGSGGSTQNTGSLTSTRWYRVIRACNGSGCNDATSNVVQVTVVPDPVASIFLSGSTTICPGQGGFFFASASNGTGSCGFQWQRNTGSGWSNISGATGSSYATGGLSTTTTFRVIRSCSGSGCDDYPSNQITITVDPTPPNALCKNISINLSSGGSASISATQLNNGSSDNCGVAGYSASKTSFNCSNVGNNTVVLTVTDVQGNTATCNSIVTVNDVTNPTALCRNVTIQLNSSGNGSMSNSHVDNGSSDACGIASYNTSKTSWNCSNVGNNTVTMTVTDNNGNQSSCTANVNVQDNVNPIASCRNVTIQLQHNGTATMSQSHVNNGSSDACGIANFATSKTAWNCSNVGANTVTMTVTDVNGNFSSCQSTVTVQDNVAPDAICKTVIVQLDVNGNGSQSHSAVNNNSFDACGIASFVSSKTTWNCSNVGSNPITLTVTDVNGNVSTCTGTIVVQDNVPPTITCPLAPFNNIFRANDPTECEAFISMGPPTNVTDACGIATVLNDFNGGTDASDDYPVGLTTVTWTATDVNGNTTTCQDFILVVDTESPTMACQNVTVQLGTNGIAVINASQVDNGSFDNCNLNSLVLSQNIFTCADAGSSNTITLTGSDGSGNQSSCTATVTVEDNLAPTALCNSFTAPLDASGNVNLTPGDVNSGSSDNCGIVNYSLNVSTFNCSDIGSNPVVLTVTDAAGNSSSCTATVTVDDQANPNAVCADLNLQLDASGDATIDPNAIAGASTDNCAISFIAPNPPVLDCSNLGANTVQVFVSDVNGNITFCIATVTVEDATAPSITCPANISVGTDANQCGAVVNYATPTATDNCAVTTTLAAGFNSGALFPVGSTTVTYDAVDASGNTASCSFSVAVTDNDAPTALCTDLTVQLDAGGSGSTTASAVDDGSTDACGIVSYSLNQSDFDCSDVGANTVTLTVTDAAGNSASCTSTVTVEDNVDPTAACNNLTVQLDASGNGSTTAAAVDGGSTDACGIASTSLNQTNFTCANVGSNTVQLSVTDNNGNTATCLATITVEDNIAPTATCQNISVPLDVNGQAVIVAADVDGGSSDACGVSLSADPLVFNCASIGNNNVLLTVTDPSGNSSTCTAIVEVVDALIPGQSPNAACIGALTVSLDASGVAVVTPTMLDDGSYDNCALTLVVEPNTFGCADVGLNSVQLIGTDDANNSDTCVTQVTIVDDTPPTAVCQNITKALNAAGTVSITANEVDGGSSDACGIASLAVSPSTFGCANVGNNGVTLTVTDNNGNTSSCVAIVTIEDNTPPTASCQDITIQLSSGGTASIFATDVDNGSSDACGIISLAVSPSGFTCANVGPNTVTLTVTDANLNTSTCTAVVTVEDNVAPVALCSDATVQLDATGNGSVTPGDIDDGSNDACGIAGLSLSQTAFDCSHVGANTVVLTASDNNGNSSTCTATVTVEDNVAPIASCQNLTVQLDAAGNGSTSAAAVDNGSSDACGIASLTLDNSSFTCANVGANTVQLTVTDNNGNSSNCLATITVEDNVPPITLCTDVTVQLNASGNGSTTANDVDGGSNDACGIASLSLSQTAFDCSHVGANTVILTATDVNANSSTCTATVTVEDNVAPIASCRDLTVQLDANGDGSTTASAVDNGSSDACGIASLSLSQTAFDCSHVGGNTVVLTVSDVNGNSSTCSATITVEDNVAPVATCQNITIQLDNAGDASITAADVDGGSSDACGIASLSVSTTDFDCSNVGGNPVTLTVTDNNGNSSNCNAIVVVEDNVAPVAACQDLTVQLDALGGGSTSAAAVDNGSSDACGIANLSLDITNFDCSDIGANTVTLTATDVNGNSASCTATITVEDNVAPIAICQNITVQLDATGNASIGTGDIDNGSSDACGIAGLSLDITAFDCNDVGANTVTMTVTDNNGNVTTCSSTVTVEDNVDPVALCQNLTIQLDAGGVASITTGDVDAGSSDACGIASLSLDNSLFLCTNVGANTVTLTATDNNGNTGSCTATITVEDNVAPVANCRNVNVLLDATGNASITPGDVNDGSSDACGIASLSLDVTAFDCSDVGPNSVVLTVTDNNGNVSSCGALATVVDAVAPVALCQDITIQLDALGEASIVAEDVDAGSTDACGVASLALDITAFTCAEVGPNSVTLTVTDINGNASTCLTTVTVEDNVAPVALCQTAVVELDAAGLGSITTGDIDAGSNDACGIASLSLDITDFDCSDVGANTVALTVVDVNGNSSSCSTTVLVNDNVAPVALCQDTTVELDVNGFVSIGTGHIDDGSNDACGIASLALDITSFTCAEVGPNNVMLTVTDNNGNVSMCTSTVTVEDNVAPEALCQDITLELDENGSGEISAPDIDAGSNDACDIASTVLDNLFFGCADVGPNTVTLTATDVNNNSSSCTATVTVVDIVAPDMFCQDITIQLDANGDASITTGDIDNGSFDACGIASFALDSTAFDCSEVGANTVTLSATDVNGNSNSCTAIVTVEDNVAPIALCQDLTLYLDAEGEVSILPTDVDAGSNDACGIDSFSLDIDLFTCDEEGSGNIITLTVYDNNGNTTTCTADMTVLDTIPPVLVCKDATIQLDSFGTVTIGNSPLDNPNLSIIIEEIDDACGIGGGFIDKDTYTCADVGVNTQVFTIFDVNGNVSTCTMQITVEDVTAPTITCPADITVIADSNDCDPQVFWTVPTPADACGTTLTSTHNPGDEFYLGTHTVTYTVEDPSGNITTCDFTVTVNPKPLTVSLVPSVYACGYNVSCNGAADGSIDAPTAGGCLPYSYLWSDGQTTQTATGLTAGTYSVTVSSPSGQTVTDGMTLTEPDALASTIVSTNVTCFGFADGTIDLTVTGGCAPYTYSWVASGFSANTEDLTNLAPGFYKVVFTDQNGCTGFNQVIITEPPLLEITSLTSPTFIGGYNITCNGANDGSIDLEVTGGTTPYSYNWAGPNGYSANTQDLSGLAAGTYSLTLTDANGCLEFGSITLTEPDPLVTGACNDHTVVFGYYPENVTSIPTTTVGGVAPYTYAWSNGETTDEIQVAPTLTTTYTVTVTDVNGCTTTISTTVTVVDVTCGSTPGFVTMCDGATDRCVKERDVPRRLNEGWFLGTCADALDLSHGDCGEPIIPGCNCVEGVTSVTLEYNGAGATSIVFSEKQNGQGVIASYNNVSNGDLLTFDASALIYGKFDNYVYVNIDGNKFAIFTNCQTAFAVGSDPSTTGTGDFTLIEYVDYFNNTCSGAVEACLCQDQLKLLQLKYRGTSGATVNVYEDQGQNNLIQTFFNVQNGDTLLINGSIVGGGELKATTIVEIVGSGQPLTLIDSDCKEGIIGKVFGDFEVTAYVDRKDNACGQIDEPCPCQDAITYLGLIYDGPANGTVIAYAKNNHTDTLGIFTNLNPGDTIVVGPSGINANKLRDFTYFEVAGSGNPDIAVATHCQEYLENRSYGDLLTFGYIDAKGTRCHLEDVPGCPCEGGIVEVTVEYDLFDQNSTTNVTLIAYGDPAHQDTLGVFTGVDPGDAVTISGASLPAGVLNAVTYVEIVGVNGPDIKINTDCSSDITGDIVNELLIVSYEDSVGNYCESDCGLGKTLMCWTPPNQPSRTRCVNNNDVSKKLASPDWTIGPCPVLKQGPTTGIQEEDMELIAYPNPFSSTATIQFRLPADDRVELVVTSISGATIAKLYSGDVEAGRTYRFTFEGESVADAVYFYTLRTSDEIYNGKLMMIK